jgi:tRNA A-37 threonylcarbamoyl transferase component Bud32
MNNIQALLLVGTNICTFVATYTLTSFIDYTKHGTNRSITESIVKDDAASKTYKTYTKFVKNTFDNENINVYKNEKRWLQHLGNTKHSPKLLYYNDELRMLVTTDMGDPLTKEHLASINIEKNTNSILSELSRYNCRHNDIKPSELVFKNGQINVVDFGWAHYYDKQNPSTWPSCLGDRFKCTPYCDEGSIKKSIDFIIKHK